MTMASPFAAIAAAAEAATRAALGEVAEFIARKGGELAEAEDQERPGFSAPVVLSRGAVDGGIKQTNSPSRAGVIRYRVSIVADDVAAMPWRPRRGDHVHVAGQRFVVDYVPQVSGGMVMDLTTLGAT